MIYREVWYREAQALPTLSFRSLFHWGTMNPADKGKSSLEGGGLSVTTHPEEWAQITPLGGCRWRLTKPGGRFLDARALSPQHSKGILQWGVKQGYVEPREIYRVSYWDDELEDTVMMDFESKEEAEEEADFMEAEVTVVSGGGFVPTTKLESRTGVSSSIAEAFDHLLTVYVEANTDFDGVWWEDEVDPLKYSSPRGVISRKKLPEWKAVVVRE